MILDREQAARDKIAKALSKLDDESRLRVLSRVKSDIGNEIIYAELPVPAE